MNFALLEKYAIPTLAWQIAKSKKSAIEAAQRIGYPVALKLISSNVLHKSEHHALSLNLKTPDSVAKQFSRLIHITDDKNSKVLVQKFVPSSLELIVGGKYDPQFGPTIMVGLGGIYTEILHDATIVICPPTRADVRAMLSKLKAYPILVGTRGQKGINLMNLEGILFHLSNLMINERPKELDINPLLFTKKGLIAADVRVLR